MIPNRPPRRYRYCDASENLPPCNKHDAERLTLLQILSRYRTFKSMGWETRRTYYRVRVLRYAWSFWRSLFYPVYYPIAWVLGQFGYRFLVSRPGGPRIGHLATEPQFYVKAGMVSARPEYRAIMLGSRGMVANTSLRDYWKRYFKVITNPIAELPLRPLAWMAPTRYQLYPLDIEITADDGKTLTGHPGYDDVFIRYAERFGDAPVLTLTAQHEERGRRVLEQLGMPRGEWFVALHVREDGFIPSRHSQLRNDDIHDFLGAVELITSRGGWVVRLGNPTMKPLPQMPNVIDYVFTDARSEWMDIFLLGSCRCFLGSDSGPVVVPALFGRPAAVIGMIPMGHGFIVPDSLYIPKLYQSRKGGRCLTFPEILLSELRDLWTTEQFEEADLTWVDNTRQEISALTSEMLDRLDGVASYTEEDERLRNAFRSLLLAKSNEKTSGAGSHIGRDFVQQHKALFEAPDSDNKIA